MTKWSLNLSQTVWIIRNDAINAQTLKVVNLAPAVNGPGADFNAPALEEINLVAVQEAMVDVQVVGVGVADHPGNVVLGHRQEQEGQEV